MSKKNTPFGGLAIALTILTVIVGIPTMVGVGYFIVWVSQFAVQIH